MNSNILRQLKDIQFQADKIIDGNPSVEAIVGFGKYSEELKTFLKNHSKDEMVNKLIAEIPVISKNEINIKKGLLAMFLPSVLIYWYHEKEYIKETIPKIHLSKGKYASIEFILKNNS